jgi:hypothetical protein
VLAKSAEICQELRMTLKGIEINRAIADTRRALETDGGISPGLRAVVEVLIVIIQLLLENIVDPTSRNSHVAPSQDLSRRKNLQKKGSGKRKTGGQPRQKGSTIERV